VSMTQKYQLTIIMGGMLIAGFTAFNKLPDNITFTEAFKVAGEMGKLNLINLSFDLSDRYNIWSGLIGGLFLFLSYFGADQSQVGRYLGGKSVAQSRLGLIFNGLLKVPMQFIILYIGILVFVFYQFHQAPVFHNESLKEKAMQTEYAGDIKALESEYDQVFSERRKGAENLVDAIRKDNPALIEQTRQSIEKIQEQEKGIRSRVKEKIAAAIPGANTLDKDYVFITFVMTYLPHGLIGLLLAVVFSAAMASTSSELNSLASTTAVDIYKRSISPKADDYHYVKASKWFTAGWAVFGMMFASIANQAENLIQFVNIIGSLFYGTILGIFLSAFYIKYIKSNAVFIAAIIAEAVILYCYFFTKVAFLLYNIIGCVLVIVIAFIIQFMENQKTKKASQ
ncbi:MAG: sodium:solute symporter, partial [Cyclobacteriaceae bacterium]